MSGTDDVTREQPRTPVWRRLLLQAAIGAAGAAGSAAVTWFVYWLQHR
ncbi:hypothetical protein [Streptomyces sp. R44]|uniref:Uncharacterized protein n=1 Tax=Streptomyces sp. R44 TaxID=3238633 RepID=A0AB39SQU9_9ACTN